MRERPFVVTLKLCLYLGRVLGMSRRRRHSPQTRSILHALHARAEHWQHGYDLACTTGLKSGTLYPILKRLADEGVLDAEWEHDPPEGRPRRHLYRLSTAGAALAAEAPVSQQQVSGWAALRLASEGGR